MWEIHYYFNGKKQIYKSDSQGSLLAAIDDFYSKFGYLGILLIKNLNSI